MKKIFNAVYKSKNASLCNGAYAVISYCSPYKSDCLHFGFFGLICPLRFLCFLRFLCSLRFFCPLRFLCFSLGFFSFSLGFFGFLWFLYLHVVIKEKQTKECKKEISACLINTGDLHRKWVTWQWGKLIAYASIITIIVCMYFTLYFNQRFTF